MTVYFEGFNKMASTSLVNKHNESLILSSSSPTQFVQAVSNADGSDVGSNSTPTETRPASSTVSSVASSATNVTLLASNAARRMATIYNDSTQILYLKVGSATASSTSYTTQLTPNAYYEVPFPVCTGIIDGIWASANGSARITEW